MFGGVSSGEDQRFFFVNAQPREMRERTNKREGRIDASNVVSGYSKIISKRKTFDVRQTRESIEKRVKSEDKQERGERTTLLNTSLDVNRSVSVLTEKRGDTDIRKGTSNKTREPRGETKMVYDTVDPRVVNGVKSFGSIKEKEKSIDFLFNTLKEEGIDV